MGIGLALSGGGIRGVAHIGAIKALEENNIKIKAIGGTSAGSLVALLYAMGYTPDEMYNLFKKYAKTIVKVDHGKIRKEIVNFIFKRRVNSMGINSGEFIELIYDKLGLKKGIKKMEDIKIPTVIPAVNISSSEEYIFTSIKSKEKNHISDISVGKAARASSSFPVVYMPLEYKGELFLDGGILNNMPVCEIKKTADLPVLAVSFDSDIVNKDSNAMDIIMKAVDIMGRKISEDNLKSSDYLIEIPTDGTGLLDINNIDLCYKSGYETVLQEIDKIRKIKVK